MSFDPKKVAEELQWLKDHPQFDEKPASIREFLGPDYLNDDNVRPSIVDVLVDIFGEEVNPERIAKYESAMMTGGIGIGKTTFASVAIPYMAHYVLCMKDPQGFYKLMKGTRIAFMQMSTSEKQAAEVVFGDLKARIENSPWFTANYPFDRKYEKQLRFPQKDIWILPGDSTETSFEGYNILGGILDEMDSHKITDQKDYADVGFDAIENRISSRFPVYNEDEIGHRGLLVCIGQMKKANGFAARKYKQFTGDPKAYTKRMAIWESLGWENFTRPDGTRASFFYDTKTKKFVPAALVGIIVNPNILEVPLAYEKNFLNNPEKALKDLAGIPPATNSPFISMVDRIEACRDRWNDHYQRTSPVLPDPARITLEPWFRGGDRRKHVIHLDFGLSRDAMGISLGHVDRLVEREDELKPYIVIDAMIRVKARPGEQIIYSDIRRTIYDLKEERKFNVVTVTMDGFQSTDTQQQLRKRKFHVEDLSMDKSMLAYEDLREAIYEERLEFPEYMTYQNIGDTQLVEIAVSELMQLQDTGKKVDHPPGGSKDVTDALAGVVTTLMGDRSYRRGLRSDLNPQGQARPDDPGQSGLPDSLYSLPGFGQGLQAPSMPSGFELMIPSRLQPSKRGR